MNKKKLKLFLKIFFLLLVIQFIIVMINILLNNADSSFASITSFIISIFSLPLSLISNSLPFYTGEGILVTLMFWILNLAIQTLAIYGAIRIMIKIK